LNYRLRNQDYVIELSKEKYTLRVNKFAVSNNRPFAIDCRGNEIYVFNRDEDNRSMKISSQAGSAVDILDWSESRMNWKTTAASSKKSMYEVYNLKVNESYQLLINNKPIKKYKVGPSGSINFDVPGGRQVLSIRRL
jgi:hypothetical protein